jgi:hypothetical protein
MSRRFSFTREEATRLKKHLMRLQELLDRGGQSLSLAPVSRHYLADLSSKLASRSEAKPLVENLLSLLEPGSEKVLNNKEALRHTIACLWKLCRLDELEFRPVEPDRVPQGEKQ